ncbi:hypothetical protein AAG906_015104 [Vitis piasezkii]
MARSFVLWLHGLDDSGPANEHIKALFTSSEFRNTVWSFPSAPSIPVTCNNGAITPSWFDIHEIPVTTDSTKDENGVLKAVKHVHAMLDKELAAGTNPNNVFVCGESQGGALTLASVLLYPRTLGGGAIFSGWVPFNSSIIEQIPPGSKKTPILWLHGMADRTVLFETGQAGQHFLEQAGVSCEFKSYPGLGHSISNEELQDLESWIITHLQRSFHHGRTAMDLITVSTKPIALLTITLGSTIFFILILRPHTFSPKPDSMARSFVLWLHGLGDSGPANEPIKTLFTSPEFRNTIWKFPSAPSNPVTCNYGSVMPSWFDIHEIPVTADSPKDENGVLKAVQNVHAMIDKELAAGTNPKNIFVCGFSQGGALTLASVLLYPRTLGGGAVFSGWVPFNSTMIERMPADAKKTPILWSHGMADRTVLFEAGQAGPPFLEQAGVSCEFKAYPGLAHSISNEELRYLESWIKTRLQSSS